MEQKQTERAKKQVIRSNCDDCVHYEYDEELCETVCEVNLDEDEYAQYLTGSYRACPYYQPYDEYKVVRKQN